MSVAPEVRLRRTQRELARVKSNRDLWKHRALNRKGASPAALLTFVCEFCKESFTPKSKPRRDRPARYCSRACGGASARAGQVPTSRLAVHMAQFAKPLDNQRNHNSSMLGGYMALSHLSGVNYETLANIRSGKKKSVSFDTADKIISRGLGRPELWHLPPEDGGFSDLFEDTA